MPDVKKLDTAYTFGIDFSKKRDQLIGAYLETLNYVVKLELDHKPRNIFFSIFFSINQPERILTPCTSPAGYLRDHQGRSCGDHLGGGLPPLDAEQPRELLLRGAHGPGGAGGRGHHHARQGRGQARALQGLQGRLAGTETTGCST